MKEYKFMVFTDLHYNMQEIGVDADMRLASIMERAELEEVAFVIQLGDFLHDPVKTGWLAKSYVNSPLPAYSALGNHDTDMVGMEYIMQLFKMNHNYYFFDAGGYRFIVLDPNYTVVQGKAVHYEPQQKRENNRGFLPMEELVWMKQVIMESPYPCILFSHQSLERTDGISNRDDAWEIICEANRKCKDSVILCINGHYHCDDVNFINDVCCLDLNSSTYHWTDVENHYYPKEYYMRYPAAAHCIGYDTALSAVISLKGTEQIMVQGCQGEFLFSPDEEEILRLDQRRLSQSRVCIPRIRNYRIDLKNRGIWRE